VRELVWSNTFRSALRRTLNPERVEEDLLLIEIGTHDEVY
jgi:hypothetical protein